MSSIAALAVAGGAGCKRDAVEALEHHSFPGFSLTLPAGKPLATTPSVNYAIGSLSVVSDHEVAIVAWSATGKLEGDELDVAVKVMGGEMNVRRAPTVTTTRTPGKSDIETIRFETDRLPLLLSQLPCGKRNIIVASGGDDSVDVDARHARILASFACTAGSCGRGRARVDPSSRIKPPTCRAGTRRGATRISSRCPTATRS